MDRNPFQGRGGDVGGGKVDESPRRESSERPAPGEGGNVPAEQQPDAPAMGQDPSRENAGGNSAAETPEGPARPKARGKRGRR